MHHFKYQQILEVLSRDRITYKITLKYYYGFTEQYVICAQRPHLLLLGRMQHPINSKLKLCLRK